MVINGKTKASISVALAYTGVIVGAGLSSGQDILQYFLCFGFLGLVGVVLMGLLNVMFGRIIVALGSYYLSENHADALSKIAHPIAHRIIDVTLVISSFGMGFVMVAGAGANLEQQFGLPAWIGALVCSLLIILVSFLDFDKITKVLGVFTPVIVLMILCMTLVTLGKGPFDLDMLDELGRTIKPAIPNPWLSVVNYFCLCLLTGISMAFVLGGSLVSISVAERGGGLGGAIVGTIVIAASVTLFCRLDSVIDAEIPMLVIAREIHPAFAFVYALVIFALIFNTAFSLYYATARRFSSGSVRRMRLWMIVLVALGYALSFAGFKSLIGAMYPALGYMGVFAMLVILLGWRREKPNLSQEKRIRKKMLGIMVKKYDDNLEYTEEDRHHFRRLAHKSAADTDAIKLRIKHIARRIVDEHKEG